MYSDVLQPIKMAVHGPDGRKLRDAEMARDYRRAFWSEVADELMPGLSLRIKLGSIEERDRVRNSLMTTMRQRWKRRKYVSRNDSDDNSAVWVYRVW